MYQKRSLVSVKCGKLNAPICHCFVALCSVARWVKCLFSCPGRKQTLCVKQRLNRVDSPALFQVFSSLLIISTLLSTRNHRYIQNKNVRTNKQIAKESAKMPFSLFVSHIVRVYMCIYYICIFTLFIIRNTFKCSFHYINTYIHNNYYNNHNNDFRLEPLSRVKQNRRSVFLTV